MFINADLKRIGRDLYHVTKKYSYRKVNFGGVLNIIYDGCLKRSWTIAVFFFGVNLNGFIYLHISYLYVVINF